MAGNCELEVLRAGKNVPLPEFERLLNDEKLLLPFTGALVPDDDNMLLGLKPNPIVKIHRMNYKTNHVLSIN